MHMHVRTHFFTSTCIICARGARTSIHTSAHTSMHVHVSAQEAMMPEGGSVCCSWHMLLATSTSAHMFVHMFVHMSLHIYVHARTHARTITHSRSRTHDHARTITHTQDTLGAGGKMSASGSPRGRCHMDVSIHRLIEMYRDMCTGKFIATCRRQV